MENETHGAPSIALRTLAIAVLVAFGIGFTIGIVAHAKFYPCVVVPTISVQRDTVRKTDTIRGKITPAIIRTTIRRDTLILPSKPNDTTHSDTASVDDLSSDNT
jgi:hypothetical protein